MASRTEVLAIIAINALKAKATFVVSFEVERVTSRATTIRIVIKTNGPSIVSNCVAAYFYVSGSVASSVSLMRKSSVSATFVNSVNYGRLNGLSVAITPASS